MKTPEEKREYMRKWNAENKEWRRNWANQNREKRNLRAKELNSTPDGKQKKSASFKKWRSKNTDSEKARWIKYYEENKDSLRQRRLKTVNKASNAARSRDYYQKKKNDPVFQKKNRARAKSGKRKRGRIEMKSTKEERKLVSKYIMNIRSMKSVECYYCSSEIPGVAAHIDHVVPLAKGGPHNVGNLCCACPPCNLRKNSKTPEQFCGMLSL